MKTNHQRGFVARKERRSGGQHIGDVSYFSDVIIGAVVPWEFSDGNRGEAKNKKGAKKYVRSRIRCNDKVRTRKIMANLELCESL